MLPRANKWEEWRNHILITQEKLVESVEKLDEKVGKIDKAHDLLRNEVRLKSSMWGSIVGFITSFLASIFLWRITKGDH